MNRSGCLASIIFGSKSNGLVGFNNIGSVVVQNHNRNNHIRNHLAYSYLLAVFLSSRMDV